MRYPFILASLCFLLAMLLFSGVQIPWPAPPGKAQKKVLLEKPVPAPVKLHTLSPRTNPPPPPPPEATNTALALRWDSGLNQIVSLSTQEMRWVTIEWSNTPAPLSLTTNWATHLSATTNLKDWADVFATAYRTGGLIRVTLSNRPPAELYRAYNSW